MNAWTQNVLQRDIDMMDEVSKNMRNTLVILVTVSTIVYCVLEFVLLESASSHLHDIFVLNKARSSSMSAIYFARDATIAAFSNDTLQFNSAIGNLVSAATIAKSFISNSSFTADTYSFLFFSKELAFFSQVSGTSVPDHVSPASGMQLFADACLQFAASSIHDVNEMVRSDDFSSGSGRALQFLLMNGDSPLVTSYDAAGMYLQGQAVSFVYLSGVFFVIAGVVVVMLGVHMVVLARRLLSEAIILLRTSTICISASLHLSQLSRKNLSTYYKKLDASFTPIHAVFLFVASCMSCLIYSVDFIDSFLQQEFAQMSGEGGLEAADGGGTMAEGAVATETHRDQSPAADSGDDSESSYASSDGKSRLHPAFGVEVSTEDKDIMIKAFLEGNDSLHVPEADFDANDAAMQADVLPDELADTAVKNPLSSDVDFTTPPTKLFLRTGSVSAAGFGIQDGELAAQETGDQEGAVALRTTKTRFKPLSVLKSASSSKQRVETFDAPVSEENSGSQDGGLSWSERNQRDRKMAFIVVLCASVFVIFNAATYLYLSPVKIGSALFDELHTLLAIQAQLDLPKSRFFPILLHVVQLMNPLLIGIDRQIQMEHLKALVIDFKESLSEWQLEFSSNAGLSAVLKDELSIGMNM